MALQVTAPISTDVIESNPDCPISGAYENGVLMITVDTRSQHVHQRLGLGTKTRRHWGKERAFAVQERSALAWPIRYRVLTRDGDYVKGGQRVPCTTSATGLDTHRAASEVCMRAAVLLVIVAGVGYRHAAWLLQQLVHVVLSQSALHRWVEESADALPSADEIITARNAPLPITEAHGDALVPRGTDACVLVLQDAHGRMLAPQEVGKRDAQTVVPCLRHLTALGVALHACSIDGCKAYDNAIRTVCGQTVALQYDSCHMMQNVWRHVWKWAVARRRQMKARRQEVSPPWEKKKLEALATTVWKHRSVLLKADNRMREEAKQPWAEIVEAACHVGKLRAFLGGVWRICEDSQDEQEARDALAALQQMPIERARPEQCKKVVTCLAEHCEWMTADVRHEGVKRHALAERGMRVLRRLAIEHDGFRSDKGRSNCLRIYQAVKYLGWTVHRSPMLQTKPT